MAITLPVPTRIAQPLTALRQRFRAWWQARLPKTDTLQLTQRNVFILPTRAGWMYGLTLLVLLLASINYQLSLGYVLTFLLAGCGVVSMHLTHNTLRGLTLHLRTPVPVFAGDPALLDIALTSPDNPRFGIGLRMQATRRATLTWTDVPALGRSQTQVSFVPPQRGRHAVPAVIVETRFPLGLFRAWTVWRPAAQLLVYPRPEQPVAPLPPSRAVTGEHAAKQRTQGSEVEGIRAYRRGDALKLVVWKKAARNLEAGGDLVSRDTSMAVRLGLSLDWQQCAGLPAEDRLARLTAWVLAADRSGASHSLRLPGVDIGSANGEQHRRRCLEALALWA